MFYFPSLRSIIPFEWKPLANSTTWWTIQGSMTCTCKAEKVLQRDKIPPLENVVTYPRVNVWKAWPQRVSDELHSILASPNSNGLLSVLCCVCSPLPAGPCSVQAWSAACSVACSVSTCWPEAGKGPPKATKAKDRVKGMIHHTGEQQVPAHITSGTSTSWSGDSPPSSLVFLFLLLRTLWMKFLWKSQM